MKKTIAILLVLISVLSVGFTAGAAAPTGDYTINDGVEVAVPDVYDYAYTINTVLSAENERTHFSRPTDLFMDASGNLYVADTGNGRVVKMTKDGQLLMEYTTADGEDFLNPQGMYVKDNGEIFIADTGNSRIVHLTAEGELIQNYGLPDSPMLSDILTYNPTKIGMTEAGALYVLMGENIMRVDSSNTFRGYIGQADVGFSLKDAFLRAFASEEQKKVFAKKTASPYTNFCLDSRGMIYAVSRDTEEGQIKVLNTIGNNIYKKVGSRATGWTAIKDAISSFFSGNIISKEFMFGEIIEGEQPQFSDICVDKNGIITVVEEKGCHLYQYDSGGNLLAVFGGKGNAQGEFEIPVSIVVDDEGCLYVLDQTYGTITVLEPTAFIQTVQKATLLYDEGDYEGSEALWQEVLSIDETYPTAYYGAGKTAMKKKDWRLAMEYFRNSVNREEYSTAFAELRYEFMKSNFWVVALVAVVAFMALLLGTIVLQGKAKALLEKFELGYVQTITLKNGILFGTNVLFRPARFFEAIKYGRGRVKIGAPLLVLIAVFVVRIIFIFTVHYPFQDVNPDEANLVLEFIKLMLPVLTWIIAVYLLSAQMDGESTLKENFICVGYSMIPYILANVIAMCLSHVMGWGEKGIFAVLVNGVTIWYIYLFFRAVQRLNDYTIKRTIGVSLISVFAMVLIWFVALFGYSLVVCLIQFVQDIFLEAQLMM